MADPKLADFDTLTLRYLDGLLSDEELESFGRQIASDEARERRFVELCFQVQSLEESLKTERAAFALSGPTPRFSSPKHPSRRTRYVSLALAASLLIGLTLAFFRSDENRELPTPTALAEVRSTFGDVDIVVANGEVRPAVSGASLYLGQTLRVKDEERPDSEANGSEDGSGAVVVYPDGTEIRISPGSVVDFTTPAPSEGKSVRLRRGSVQVRASKQPADRPMVLRTEHARVVVLGTRFRLYSEEKSSRVELDEGKVELVRKSDGKSMEVAEGSYAVATADIEPMMDMPRPLASGRCELRGTLPRAGDRIYFAPDGRSLVGSTQQRSLLFWDLATEKVAHRLTVTYKASAWKLAFLDNNTVIGVSPHGAVVRWQPPAAEVLVHGSSGKGDSAVNLSADGRWIVQARGKTAEVVLWKSDEKPVEGQEKGRWSGKASAVAVSSVGPRVAFATNGGHLHVLDVPSGGEVFHTRLPKGIARLTLSDDGRYLAALSYQSGLWLYDLTTRSELPLWESRETGAANMRFSSDNRLFLTALKDGTVRVWTTANGESRLVLDTGDVVVHDVALSPDGSRLATVGEKRNVKLWDFSTIRP